MLKNSYPSGHVGKYKIIKENLNKMIEMMKELKTAFK